jgi:NADPH2:quinone reductase
MKALRRIAFGPIETLKIEAVPAPEPGAGQVRVRVKSASPNFSDAPIKGKVIVHPEG